MKCAVTKQTLTRCMIALAVLCCHLVKTSKDCFLIANALCVINWSTIGEGNMWNANY